VTRLFPAYGFGLLLGIAAYFTTAEKVLLDSLWIAAVTSFLLILVVIILASSAALLVSAWSFGNLNPGWDQSNFWGGFRVRASPSFSECCCIGCGPMGSNASEQSFYVLELGRSCCRSPSLIMEFTMSASFLSLRLQQSPPNPVSI
jgi:hypothetical protein